MTPNEIGTTIAILSISMVSIVLLTKIITTAVGKLKAKKRRRKVEPSSPRKHIMSSAERNVARALQNANRKRGIKND